MPFLASDVIADAQALLNDTSAQIYTSAALLPFVKRANRELEQVLIINGSPVQRVESANISVFATITTLSLPTDFLLPIELNERPLASTSNDDWVPMTEMPWIPDIVAGETLDYWAFRNNAIYLLGATVDRTVRLRYERQLAVITSTASPEDSVLFQNFLGAKTAELAARFIGMNEAFAQSLHDNESKPAKNDLEQLLVLQGSPVRRQRFTIGKQTIY